ncbi:MAG: hypothetical protein KAI27_06425 [Rhodospirillaceae bacterium]|nr:hypothetical protein [Rhodospirillaceae bacterium]
MSVDTLSKRVLDLESSLGLAGQGTYSERLLLLLDYIEAEPLAVIGKPTTDSIGGDDETIEEKLAKIKKVIGMGSNDDNGDLPDKGSIEEMLEKIEAALSASIPE